MATLGPKTSYGVVRYLPITKPSGVTAAPLFAFHFSPDEDWLTDRTGNGRDATVVTGGFEFLQDPDTGLWGIYLGAGDHELILPAEELIRIAQDELAGGDASMTLEVLVRQESLGGMICCCDSGGESLGSNYLWQLGPTWDNAGVRQYYQFNERGGGTNIAVSSTAKAIYNTLIYLALTVSADGTVRDYWVNAVKAGTVTTNAAEKNSVPASNVQRVRFGRQENDAGDFGGYIFSARLTPEIFVQADFQEVYDGLFGEIIVGDGDDGAQVEDVVGPVGAGGPGNYGDGVPKGVRMPGPADQQLGSMGPFDAAPIEDVVTVLDQGAPAYSSEQDGAAHLPGQTSGPEAIGVVEDVVSYILGGLTDFRQTTNDFNGHPHFISERITKAFIYDAVGEAGLWTTPTNPAFTGYGKDGKYYVAGVDQLTFAPWYDEVESDDRGPTKPFPDKVLICVGQNGAGKTNKEIVIFDLDSFPTTLNVWMRFKFNSANNTPYAVGNENRQIASIAVADGVLVVGSKNNAGPGACIIIDFKGVGQGCGFRMQSNDDWLPVAGKTLVDRNTAFWTTTGGLGYRIDSDYVYAVSAHLDTDGQLWVACAGEDPGPNLFRINTLNAHPNRRILVTGDTGDANIADVRKVAFDMDHNWWFSIKNRIHRVVPIDYQDGYAYLDTSVPNRRRGGADEWVDLPHDVICFAAVGDYLFVGTEVGVYRVHRGSMYYALAYTIADGGGGGSTDTPPDGEIIPGTDPEILWLTGHALHSAHYLAVATRRGVATIRTLDDRAVDSRLFPDLDEPGAHFNVALVD